MLGARKTWGGFASRAPYAATVLADAARGAKDIGRFREAEGARGHGGGRVALSKDGALEPAPIPSSVAPAAPGEARGSLTLRKRMDAYERGIIVEALRACRNNEPRRRVR
jgi:hypothetical protein